MLMTWIPMEAGQVKMGQAKKLAGRTVDSSLVDVGLHVLVAVFHSNMALGGQEEPDLLISSTQYRW